MLETTERPFEPTLTTAERQTVSDALERYCEKRNVTILQPQKLLEFHDIHPHVETLSDVVLVNTLTLAGDWLTTTEAELRACDTLPDVVERVCSDAVALASRSLFEECDASDSRPEIRVSEWTPSSEPVQRQAETAPQPDTGDKDTTPAESRLVTETTIEERLFKGKAGLGSSTTGATVPAIAADLRSEVITKLSETTSAFAIQSQPAASLAVACDELHDAGYQPDCVFVDTHHPAVASDDEADTPDAERTAYGLPVRETAHGVFPAETAIAADSDAVGYEVEFASLTVDESSPPLRRGSTRTHADVDPCSIEITWSCNWEVMNSNAVRRVNIETDRR